MRFSTSIVVDVLTVKLRCCIRDDGESGVKLRVFGLVDVNINKSLQEHDKHKKPQIFGFSGPGKAKVELLPKCRKLKSVADRRTERDLPININRHNDMVLCRNFRLHLLPPQVTHVLARASENGVNNCLTPFIQAMKTSASSKHSMHQGRMHADIADVNDERTMKACAVIIDAMLAVSTLLVPFLTYLIVRENQRH